MPRRRVSGPQLTGAGQPCAGLQPIRSQVPPGRSGAWEVDRFTERAPRPDVAEVRPEWAISPPGTYTRLRRGDEVFMTDLVDEWWTQRPAIEEACRRGGRVLLTGLGLGLVAEAMLLTPNSAVEHVTVVEADADVIALVAPYLAGRHGDAVTVEHADAFAWEPPPEARYGVGWHDIWPNPAESRCLPESRRLIDHYAPFCDWQGSWALQWRADTAAARS